MLNNGVNNDSDDDENEEGMHMENTIYISSHSPMGDETVDKGLRRKS